MRLARVATPEGPVPVMWDGTSWLEITSIFDPRPGLSGRSWNADHPLAAPVDPVVVVGMSSNGTPQAARQPARSFLKSARTVAWPGGAIEVDIERGMHTAEGELAVIVGKEARNVPANKAMDVILGYTIANDVTATDQVAIDPSFTHGKNGEGFTPLGPWLETNLDPSSLEITVTVDGAAVAVGSTAQLGRTIVEQIVYVTSFMTLGPGDVLLTGCPGASACIVPGQHVAIAIDGLGRLTSSVRAGCQPERGSMEAVCP